MKHACMILAAGALMVAAVSCQGPTELAGKVEGSWAGVPERLFDAGASSATVIETFTFARDDKAQQPDSGKLYMTSLMSVTAALPGAPGVVTPISVTASGYASVEGTWKAVSADKIDVSLDQSTLNVRVDPKDVLVSTDLMADADSASLMQTRPQLAASIRGQLHKVASERYRPQMTFSDVSITDNKTLKFKIDKSSYTLTRQPD